ncbi:MAG: RHS repeat-associated core domain-containing protein [Acidobacteriota bacterium]|nr:RHS repeat-associated core domain-containing protein [Acidobacteriota bacterium]
MTADLVSGLPYYYDVENRLGTIVVATGYPYPRTENYFYGPDNKRMGKVKTDYNGSIPSQELYIYGPRGERLATYASTDSVTWSMTRFQLYFAGKMLGTDRLGTLRAPNNTKYYPYGEEFGGAAVQDGQQFATYWRDASTGLDYADQRYYSNQFGRFMSPDPYGGSAKLANPGSWNRYVYVSGDPANNNDPTGLDDEGSSNGCYYNGLWYSGCEAPVGVSRFVPMTAYGRATQRLGAAADALGDRRNVSSNCQKDLDALSQAAGQTIDLGAIQGAVANTDFKNGVGLMLPVSALFGPGTEAAGAAFQRQEDAKYGPGQTIGNELARNLYGLTAETVLFGNTIFVNPALIGGSLTSNEGLLFHEALHELGLVDSSIQSALGLAVDDKNTRNITTKLQKDCISGRGNN